MSILTILNKYVPAKSINSFCSIATFFYAYPEKDHSHVKPLTAIVPETRKSNNREVPETLKAAVPAKTTDAFSHDC